MTAPEPTSTRARACLSCGDPLEPEAGEGLCSACLLGRALALASQADEGSDAESDLVAASSLEGRTLGNYEILSTLAQGGMGVVFKARQKNPSRTVALKVISAGELATRQMVERFHNEARAAARLDHPNIVPIYEVGEDRGWHYFSMQLIAGRTLADFLRAGRPEPRAAVELLVKVARAVEHAHQRGILHRDLKPTNLLLDAQGEPHLTDFGLAKVTEQDSELTLSHAVLGTPAYMSPEQAAGKSRDITTATDVYGLGAIFYELLSGRPPFTAESTPALLRKIAEEDPASLKGEAGSRKSEAKGAAHFSLPASDLGDLSVICLKCLEKDPAKRYATAGELADELERWLRHEPIRARPATTWERAGKWVRRNRGKSLALATAAASLLVIAVVSAVLGQRLAREAATNREQVVRLNLAAGNRLVADQDSAMAALHFWTAWQAARPDAAREDLHRRRLGITLRHAPAIRWLNRQDGAVNAVQFSPDGRWLASAGDDRTARLWDVASGAAAGAPLAHPASVSQAFFSPDGSRLATLCADQSLRLWSVPDGRLLVGPLPANDFRFKRPTAAAAAFSPDGKVMVVAAGRVAEILDASTGQPLGVRMTHAGQINSACFAPDGALVLTVCDLGEARLWDAATGTERFPPWILKRAQEKQWSAGAFSPDGKKALIFCHAGEASLWDTRTGAALSAGLGDGAAQLLQAGFTAGGARAYTLGMDGLFRFWDPANGNATEVRQASRLDADPSAAMADLPRGNRLGVLAGWSGRAQLLGGRDGLGDGPGLRHADMVYCAASSPDGSLVATADRSGLVRLWQTGPEHSLRQLPHGAAIVSAEFSADGAMVMTAGTDGVVRRWREDTGQPVGEPWPHAGAAVHARFNPAGTRIAVATAGGTATVWDVASGRPAFAPLPLDAPGHQVAFSPDGTRLLTLTKDPNNPDKTLARVWDAATGQALGPALPHRGWFGAGEFSPDGRSFFTGNSEGKIRRFEAATQQPLGTPLMLEGLIPEAHFSPDGTRILAGNSGGYDARPALLFELGSTRPPVRFTGHQNGVNQAVFSPDGTRVATGSFDATARIWDTATGRPLSPPLHHHGHLTRVVFSPDGRLLATASRDGTARVWDALTGEAVSPPLRHGRPVRVVAFRPDGRRLLSAGDDGVARLWDLSPAAGTPAELRERAQLLSAHTLDAAGDPRPLSREEIGRLWERTRK